MSWCENSLPDSGTCELSPPPLPPPSSQHRSIRMSHSIGADSAIEMHDDGPHNDGTSDISSRPVSRTTNMASPTVPGLTLSQHQQLLLEAAAQTEVQPQSGDLNDAVSKNFAPTNGTLHNGLETVNPVLSRPPSVGIGSGQHGPHLIHARTYPALSNPHSTCSFANPRCAAFSCGSNNQLVPLHHGYGPGYGMYQSQRPSGPESYSPYYTVQSPIDSLSSAESLYGGGGFSADQPRDVRVPAATASRFPFPHKPYLRKTDSLMTSSTDPVAYFCDDGSPLRGGATGNLRDEGLFSAEHGLLDEKRKDSAFRHLITKTLSSVYAIFVIVLGAILYVNDVLGTVGHSYVEVFQVYLFMVAITFYIFIHIDIRRYVQTEHLGDSLITPSTTPSSCDNNQLQIRPFHRPLPYVVPTRNTAYHPCVPGKEPTGPPPTIAETSPYGFSTGRHADSLYLKLGAVAFCFGSMIHDGLVFSKRVDIVVTQPFSSCMNVIDLFTPALNLVFSFYQLYFIFKHSNIIIHRYQEIARFGVMHSIAVNLCVWFRTLVDETIDEFSRKWSGEGADAKDSTASTGKGVPDAQLRMMAEDAGWHGPAPASSAGLHADHNHTSSALSLCSQETVLANIAQEAAPYLYPFTIEYTLIAAAVWYIIWSNIGGGGGGNSSSSDNLHPPHHQASNHHQKPSQNDSHGPQGIPAGEANSKSSSHMIPVNCRFTNRGVCVGIFPGILVLVGTVISIIIFFVTISAEEYTATALIINNVSELSLYLITGVVTVFAFRKTATLNLNPGGMKHTLDDFLLFVALPCFFIFSFFSIIAGIAASNPLSIVVNTASMLQVILQTTFIFDGLRRCSNNLELQRRKPGREMITFLTVCNVAMWTFSTFEIKRSETNPSQMLFYGEFEWSIISHLSVPLTIFYRFHSSVCLVDIWHSAYQPAQSH